MHTDSDHHLGIWSIRVFPAFMQVITPAWTIVESNLLSLFLLCLAVLHEVLQDLAKAGDGAKFQNEGRTCCGVIPCRSKASISAAPISPS